MKKQIAAVMTIWLLVVGSSLYWNLLDEEREKNKIAFETAEAFFNLINITRSWNSRHGGVYVPISGTTTPNQYLKDPLRDLTTEDGLDLTMINPAFMTRQISEIASEMEGIQFHITSLQPIRPQNKATAWENEWLNLFEKGGKEFGQFVEQEEGTMYRYMAPLIVERPCLKCHQEQGYKEGDIRGGISITLPYFSENSNTALWAGYSIAAMGGLILIMGGGTLLGRSRNLLVKSNDVLKCEVTERRKAQEKTKIQNEELKEALSKVKLLSGFLPICASCKMIRDDKGYWKQIETYIRDHSEAEFSHGVCPDCAEKLYPGLLDKISIKKKQEGQV